jgi:hypothetical protein
VIAEVEFLSFAILFVVINRGGTAMRFEQPFPGLLGHVYPLIDFREEQHGLFVLLMLAEVFLYILDAKKGGI